MIIRRLITRLLILQAIILSLCAPASFGDMMAEEADFISIKKAFNDASYDLSREGLESFINHYPQTRFLYQAHTLLGRSYYKQNDLSGALYEFRMVLDTPAASEFQDEALFWSGEIFAKNSDFKSALEYYERVIEGFPTSKYLAAAVYSKGWAYYKLGLYDQALRCFSDVVSDYPMDKVSMEAQFRLGECYYLSEDYENAEAEFEKFIGRFPVSEITPEAYYLDGESKYCLGKYDRSIASLERALTISPDAKWAPLAAYRLGIAFFMLDQLSASNDYLKKSVGMSDNDLIKSYALLGLVKNCDRAAANDEGLSLCDQIIEKYPEDDIIPETYCYKIRFLMNEKKYLESEILCLETIKKYADSVHMGRMRYELGRIYLAQGKLDKAEKEFLSAGGYSKDIELKANALIMAGDTYLKNKEATKAVECYDSVLKKYPESSNADYAQCEVANISMLNGKYDQAILSYQAVLVNYPDTGLREKAIFESGIAYFNKGDYEDAFRELDGFIRVFPGSGFADITRLYMANSQYNLGRYDPALTAYKELESSSSDRKIKAMAAYQAGWCYINMRKETAASAAFENFQKNYRDSELVDDVKLWLGEHYRSQRRYDSANESFESLLERHPSDNLAEEALMQSALTLSEEGKIDGSILRLEELARRFGGSDSARAAYRKIAKIKKDKNDFDAAIEYYRKALSGAKDEIDAQTQYEIAECFQEKGDLKSASEEYFKVSLSYSDSAFWSVRAELKSAEIFEALNRQRDAARIYEKLAGMGVEESDLAKRRLDALNLKGSKQ